MSGEDFADLQERVLALPPEQKETLLESLLATTVPVPAWHREILRQRVAAADAEPSSFRPALEVVERVRAGLRRR